MSDLLAVDIERLTSAWLRDQDDLTDLVDGRVYTILPHDKAWPLVRLTLIDETARRSWPDSLYFTDSLIQFDVWADTKAVARLVADTTRALLTHLKGSHELGVVTGVRFVRYGYLPDIEFEPAKPRYQFDVHIFTHPVGSPHGS